MGNSQIKAALDAKQEECRQLLLQLSEARNELIECMSGRLRQLHFVAERVGENASIVHKAIRRLYRLADSEHRDGETDLEYRQACARSASNKTVLEMARLILVGCQHLSGMVKTLAADSALDWKESGDCKFITVEICLNIIDTFEVCKFYFAGMEQYGEMRQLGREIRRLMQELEFTLRKHAKNNESFVDVLLEEPRQWIREMQDMKQGETKSFRLPISTDSKDGLLDMKDMLVAEARKRHLPVTISIQGDALVVVKHQAGTLPGEKDAVVVKHEGAKKKAGTLPGETDAVVVKPGETDAVMCMCCGKMIYDGL